MDSREQPYGALCKAIEEKVGRQMHSSRDYEFLATCIFEATHEHVSASTLKRLWGYLGEDVTPRRYTLDLLSRYLGYVGWDDFSTQQASQEIKTREPASAPEAPKDPSTEDSPEVVPPAGRKLRWDFLVLLLFLVALLLFLFWRQVTPTASSRTADPAVAPVADKYIIRKGQTFPSFDAYLRLFGITTDDTQWFQPVPHHEGLVVWGPQYQHPEWHNEGNPDSLLPTITKYWEPATDSLNVQSRALLDRMNTEGYYMARRMNEIRITFMRGLTDSTFTFLGVYRMSLDKSDTTRIVWERIADECDLRALDYLEQLRR